MTTSTKDNKVFIYPVAKGFKSQYVSVVYHTKKDALMLLRKAIKQLSRNVYYVEAKT